MNGDELAAIGILKDELEICLLDTSYPLRMKLFDYRYWKQLTYPSLIEGADKWETELDEIIKRLMVSPQ